MSPVLKHILDFFFRFFFCQGNTHILWGDLLKPVTQACEIALVTRALRDQVASLKLQGESVAHILYAETLTSTRHIPHMNY